MTVTTAALERDSALRELKRLYQEMDQVTTDRDYVSRTGGWGDELVIHSLNTE